jgi:glucans biosynthesis protein C
MNEANSSTRLLFVDNVRIFLTFLVIMHHTLITYGGSGGWYFKDPLTDKATSIVFSVLCGLNQGFFMALFFFISAYFVPGSYTRKKTWQFLNDRLIRLGIPILIYSSIINPIMVYLLSPEPEKPFLEYYLLYFKSGAVFNGNGPLWFLVALLIFAICYCIWREFVKDHTDGVSVQKHPSIQFLTLAVISIGISAFLIRLWFPINGGATILNIQLAFVAQYIVVLILGTIAYKNDWFRSITDSQGKQWLNIALISISFFGAIAILSGGLEGDPVKMFGGFHWQSFSFAIWEGVYGVGMCIGLVLLFRKKVNTQGRVKKMLSDNAYTIYIIHAPVLVGISSLVVGIPFPPAVKFAMVLPIVLGLCFTISHFILRRIPGAKRVLG